jgi:hypothetical protein
MDNLDIFKKHFRDRENNGFFLLITRRNNNRLFLVDVFRWRRRGDLDVKWTEVEGHHHEEAREDKDEPGKETHYK